MQRLARERNFKCFPKVKSIISYGAEGWSSLDFFMSASSEVKGERDLISLTAETRSIPVTPGTEGGVGGQRHQTGPRAAIENGAIDPD